MEGKFKIEICKLEFPAKCHKVQTILLQKEDGRVETLEVCISNYENCGYREIKSMEIK